MSKVSSNPVFDENKNYTWKPEDEFVLSGNEFGFLFQLVKAEIDGVGVGVKTKLAQYEMLQNILKAAIEKGVATEVKTTPVGEPEPETAKAN